MSKLPRALQNLAIPVIGSPLFIISNPKLVIEQCKAGIIGSMPALNARPAAQLDEWLHEITETLAAYNRANPDRPAAPFAVVRRRFDAAQTAWVVQECTVWKRPPSIRSIRITCPPASTMAQAIAMLARPANSTAVAMIFFAP